MKFLIVKTSSLGDIIHAFTSLNFLKQQYPLATIDWVVEKKFSELVKAHPLIDEVIEMDTSGLRKSLFSKSTFIEISTFFKKIRQKKYDLIIDLQGNTKSAIPTFLARSDKKLGFGSKTIHEWPNLLVTNCKYNPPLHLNVRDENLYLLQHYFNNFALVKEEALTLRLNNQEQESLKVIQTSLNATSLKKILVCAGSAWKNKQITIEALKHFLQKLSANKDTYFLFAWGSIEEKKQAEALSYEFANSQVLQKLTLPLLQNVMTEVDLVIAMDSLPLHLAGTTQTKTFSIFGASSKEKYSPMGENHLSLQGACPYGIQFERRCPKLRTCKTGLCIRGLTGRDLYEYYTKKKP